MGWLSVLLSALAGFLLFGQDRYLLMTIAIIAAIGSFWSWGIMHNYATNLAQRRKNYTGGFNDLTDEEADVVPNWITVINFGFTLLGLSMLITAIIIYISGK